MTRSDSIPGLFRTRSFISSTLVCSACVSSGELGFSKITFNVDPDSAELFPQVSWAGRAFASLSVLSSMINSGSCSRIVHPIKSLRAGIPDGSNSLLNTVGCCLGVLSTKSNQIKNIVKRMWLWKIHGFILNVIVVHDLVLASQESGLGVKMFELR